MTQVNDILDWNPVTIMALLVFCLPLLSFIIISISKEKHQVLMSWLASLTMLMASLLSIAVLLQAWSEVYHTKFTWFQWAEYIFTMGLLIDLPAALMLVTVNFIAFLVHLFSIEYMKGDEGYKRYFAFLGLFTASMIGIVLADNLLVIFVFWELVGLSSYLLIGHWFSKEKAAKAATKAFIVNRIGDIGFVIGLSIIWLQFNTFDLVELYSLMGNIQVADGMWISASGSSLSLIWLTVAGIALFFGAIGKSAQFPLQIWLPDAMEGPTPVSALIHAATMVAAGVYLVARIFVLLNIDALTFIAFTGAITAMMGAVAALTQNDIKKVLAFSTISQLGYMLMGMGVGAYDAALFHLFTHAFFKAGLFLAAGSIIHSLHLSNQANDFDAQDMRNMGGLRKSVPVTFIAYVLCGLALMGMPIFSGFLSKDAILLDTLTWANAHQSMFFYLIPILGFGSVLITAVYVSRQILLVFFGEFKGQEVKSIKENSLLIKGVLLILSIMAIGVCWSINPFYSEMSWLMSHIEIPSSAFDIGMLSASFAPSHLMVSLISTSLLLTGVVFAYLKYRPEGQYFRNYSLETLKPQNFWQSLSYENWYLDQFYQTVFINPFHKITSFAKAIDTHIIDRMVNLFGMGSVIFSYIVAWFDRAFVDGTVNAVVFLTGRVGTATRSIHGSKAQSYILAAVIGLIIIIFLIF
ncbi:MAG TPA: NADH-quinone oxidoreductase subunit L [Fulvivirga sp.]|nr:NADH-quinone oxidoreductase subunit L [Fulvivirga sp.]